MPDFEQNRFWTMPAARLSVAIAIGLAFAALMIVIAMAQPRFVQQLEGGERLVSIGGAGSTIEIEAVDLTPEPDNIGSYPEQTRFFAKQDDFIRRLAADGQRHGVAPHIVRGGGEAPVPLAATYRLPFEFWMQLGVGFTIFVISAWIWAVRPRALPNRLFGITGVGLGIAASAAAIYSTRWLALPSSLFVPLANMNGFGAMLYGAAMICLFLVYPVRLASNRLLAAGALVFAGWFLLGLFDMLGSPPFETPLATAVQMLLILLLVLVQFFRSRKNPLQRAAIRWVGLSTLIGAGLFISMAVLPVVLGAEPLIEQSYAFAFFLIVHLGVAFGLRRNALFQTEQWSITMLRAVSFGFLLILVDVLLITLLGSIGSAAVLTCLLLLPLFYLPWRGFMQRWLMGDASVEYLFEGVAHIALIDNSDERCRQWEGLFAKAFSPLAISRDVSVTHLPAAIIEDGLGLHIPPTMGCSAFLVRYKANGTRLFQTRDRQLSERLVALASSLKQERDAFKQGIESERSRISRDLHDDLSARLVSGLALDDTEELKAVLRSSLAEVRNIVSAEEGDRAKLADVLADSRAEAADRLEASGMALHWPISDAPGWLEPAERKALTSVLREIVTNAIKHSGGNRLSVRVNVDEGRIYVVADDDGQRFNGTMHQGNGIRNMSARLAAVQGYFDYSGMVGTGFRVSFNLPLARKWAA